MHIPIICTDKYRREWGFHEPWKGYDTEIAPEKQNQFYEKILELYNAQNTNYFVYSSRWAAENSDTLVDTSDYFVGIENAKGKLTKIKEINEIGERDSFEELEL